MFMQELQNSAEELSSVKIRWKKCAVGVRSGVCLTSGTRLDSAVVDAEEGLEEQGKHLTPPQHILAAILTVCCRCSGYSLYPPFSTQGEVQMCLIPSHVHCSVFLQCFPLLNVPYLEAR